MSPKGASGSSRGHPHLNVNPGRGRRRKEDPFVWGIVYSRAVVQCSRPRPLLRPKKDHELLFFLLSPARLLLSLAVDKTLPSLLSGHVSVGGENNKAGF